MKWHIISRLFTKLDDFLPFFIYMVYWSLGNKKLRFLLISWSSKNGNYIFQSLNHVDVNFKLQVLIKRGYYIVPNPSTALIETYCRRIRHPKLLNFLYRRYFIFEITEHKFNWNLVTLEFLIAHYFLVCNLYCSNSNC